MTNLMQPTGRQLAQPALQVLDVLLPVQYQVCRAAQV
jgi:hypothetical protein